ncbi:undecaprenyl/decaprenyl-phosphate alpha-N-acetylglucosaminyl 1-phosphate transferase [Streptomyces cyaneochromogenes]|uniref:Undecaprenyl/decaprenyl-phosphate alpha-N-acetylglucosaminyl 1-phosphate transferase n=1 Tax=Streptomyces cyaneochromogenes TaxID=2496836 RepID=A0A3Q9EV92_9ACTN|nr:MraY family glycosyltransferase [Streptomyces cyaneochromogenes]AZQ36318.1 undecaprenyl/decaprenyl-phosphate alpha-N-acetylglucosaminyl 1-phosphate transferase [Streptomyces cyaneochromogenes]
MLYGIAAATAALLLAAFLSALFRLPALRLGIIDRRRQRPLPLFGGLAVVLATCLVVAGWEWAGVAPLGPEIRRLLIAAGAVALLGLVADVRRVKERFLVGGTAVAAAFVVPYGETGFWLGVPAIGLIVLVAVGFKALDHADGLAGTVGVVTAFGVGVLAAAEVMDELAVLLSVLAAALTGFLMHNWPPARIGFGACGSLFVGFVLAASAVMTRAGRDPVSSLGILYSLTALATADVLLVALSRRLAGRPLLRGGPDHLAHRLRRLGLTPQGVTILLGVAAFAGVAVGVLVHMGWMAVSGVYWVGVTALVVVVGCLRIKVYGPRRQPTFPLGEPVRTSSHATSTQVRAQLRVRNG